MKIGIIIGTLGFGGAERVTTYLSEYWTRENNSVTIFTTMKKPNVEYPVACGVKRFECYSGNKIKTIIKLRNHIRNDPQDVILIMDTPMCVVAIPALIGLKTPIIISERSSPSTDAIKTITRLLSHSLMNLCDGFIFQTKGAQAYYNHRIQERSVVIANPLLVDTIPSVFEGNREKRVVSVGRLIKAKDYPNLINAFVIFHKKHSDYILQIYGDGNLKKELAKMIDEKQATAYIKLMGSSGNVLEEIKSATMYILSSNIEGMPNALIEAMALGIPCIATDCPSGGPRDLIKDGENGLLVPVSDPEAIYHAMERLISNQILYDKISKSAINIRNNLDIRIISSKWIQYFCSVINSKKRKKREGKITK